MAAVDRRTRVAGSLARHESYSNSKGPPMRLSSALALIAVVSAGLLPGALGAAPATAAGRSGDGPPAMSDGPGGSDCSQGSDGSRGPGDRHATAHATAHDGGSGTVLSPASRGRTRSVP